MSKGKAGREELALDLCTSVSFDSSATGFWSSGGGHPVVREGKPVIWEVVTRKCQEDPSSNFSSVSSLCDLRKVT